MLVRRFRECASGNVAMLFGLSLLPMMGMLGLAVDYSMAAQQRTRLQSAIDSTALSVAHLSPNLTQAQLNEKANEIFAQNFKPANGATSNPITVERGKDYVKVNASASVPTSFMRVMNVDTVDVSSSGKVVWGANKIEVVLALDNTGSMASSNKMTELKKAATDLVDKMEAASTEAGQIKIGIVPFATSVRVPTTEAYKTAEWIRFDDIHYTEKVCTGKKSERVCEDVPKIRQFDKSVWRGCIWDRDQSYDVTDIVNPTETTPVGYKTSDSTTLYPALETCRSGESNLQTIVPMTEDFTALRTAIDNMQPAGATNVTIGLQWGMALLSKVQPFAESVETDTTKVMKFMIILTDGENTQNRFSSNPTSIDDRTELACAQARALGTVFSVRVIDGNQALLKACATDEDKYFDVEDAEDLTPVFNSIADEITRLRLAS